MYQRIIAVLFYNYNRHYDSHYKMFEAVTINPKNVEQRQ